MTTESEYGQPHKTLISIDPLKPAKGQKGLQNRWHPDIPAVATAQQGEIFKVECIGQVKNTDNADDLNSVDLSSVHNLSGPVRVEGAQPGDALKVELLNVEYFPQCPWGYTGIFNKEDGGLFAKEFDTKASKAIWDLEGVYASSRHVPGVRFAGIPHPGILGTAPSQELLDEWNRREQALIDAQPGASPAVALPPEPKGVYIGQDLDEAVLEKIKKEGARTIPGREHGGNCDIKNLSRGSTVWLPVFVEGANLTVGDLHFSQGDSEMSFCGAIEMSGVVTMRCTVVKGGVEKLNLKQPIFLPSPVDPFYSQHLTFQGISVDAHGDGSQHSMCATTAFKQAALNTMSYLTNLGYTLEQAYILLSAAPTESHVAALVDVPNACVTLSLPPQIFDRNILPEGMGPNGFEKRDYGNVALRSDGQRSIEFFSEEEVKKRASKKQ
ncbi:acetamidase/formamidase family protein [Sporobolomyces salmoneus]|uniref:acetamidase/formamidase family protein n=1 Tax=Sporobolomyces salmoneus TaxID=183962 RepID=UPI003174ECE1